MKPFKYLLFLLISLIGFYFLIFTFVMYFNGMFLKELCFKEECIKSLYGPFAFSWKVYSSIIEVVAYTLTSVGIFVSAMNYYLSEKTSKTISHIENFKLFDQFLDRAVRRSEFLSVSSFNVGTLYRSIYPNSRDGVFELGQEYKDFLVLLITIVDESSRLKSDGVLFDYTKHQHKIINAFSLIGVSITKLHRMDFWLVEKDLFFLINSISSDFLFDRNLKINFDTRYRVK